jgi:hypothetical protein
MTRLTFSLRAGRGLTATFPVVLVGRPPGIPRPVTVPLAIDPLSEVSGSM